MTENEFIEILEKICIVLKNDLIISGFKSAKDFESRVREISRIMVKDSEIHIDPNPPAQAFPDISIGKFGIEVKFTTNDTWLSIANSVLESNRVLSVEKVFVIFGKMGGSPDVRWIAYEDCVIHVRTSHVPRFEIEIPPTDGTLPLFSKMGINYDDFRILPMAMKMEYIRKYARSRLRPGERLWWLEDSNEQEHTLPIQARIYTKLDDKEKKRLRAEALLLCPGVLRSGRAKDKYDDVALYLLTYYGVLATNVRDMFSAGSVANPKNDDNGGLYIERAIKLIESDIVDAAYRLDDALFIEYWGESVKPENRISEWLIKADGFAVGWTPSSSLFKNFNH